MKKTYLIPAVLGLCLLAVTTPARAIDLYGFTSYWNQKDADGAWGAGLGASLPLLTDFLRLDGRMYFFEDSRADWGEDLSLRPFDLGLKVHLLPDAPASPYLLGGISWVWADAERYDVDSSFGGYLGAGLDVALPLPMFYLFGEALYRFTELDNPFGDDIDVGGFTGNIGLKFTF